MQFDRQRNDIEYNAVISPVPHEVKELSGAEKVSFLSEYARKALQYSAQISNIQLTELKKDQYGAPIPDKGVYWSISHKPEYVAAVCGYEPLGIDIEKKHPRNRDLFNYIAGTSEWKLFNDQDWNAFFRVFTAKESAIKATTRGMKDVKRCLVCEVCDDTHLILDYFNRQWIIEHFEINDHMCSITSCGNTVNWVYTELGG
jgi:4'-phosphopantetheinyl transferase